MASKHPHAGQIFLFEILNIAETEPNLTPDTEMSDSTDAVVGETFDCFGGDFPAPGEIDFCQDWARGLWYALDDRGRALVVH